MIGLIGFLIITAAILYGLGVHTFFQFQNTILDVADKDKFSLKHRRTNAFIWPVHAAKNLYAQLMSTANTGDDGSQS